MEKEIIKGNMATLSRRIADKDYLFWKSFVCLHFTRKCSYGMHVKLYDLRIVSKLMSKIPIFFNQGNK